MFRKASTLSRLMLVFSSNCNLQTRRLTSQHITHQPWLPNPQLNLPSTSSNSLHPSSSSYFPEHDLTALHSLLANPSIPPGPELEKALEETRIPLSSPLLEAIFNHADSSPKPLFCLFKWAENQPGFKPTAKLFNLMINSLGKAREFDLAWTLLRDQIEADGSSDNNNNNSKLVTSETFAILIRRYARAGMTSSAIHALEYAENLDHLHHRADANLNLFELLLDALCKEGKVRAASEYLDKKITSSSQPDWVPSIKVYNIMLNGWFRMRKLKKVENLWMEMRKEGNGITPTVVTYGTLIEGYCRMRRVEIAIELLDEMKRERIEPNALIYNPIVDALAEEGRFREALGFLERFQVLESGGPTLSTYNSLVKGFCKAGDLAGANEILKMITSRGFTPTSTTYNYYFKYFSKQLKIQQAMNLYNKMIDAGHEPDRLTFHLMMKMLCEREKLDWAVQVINEMRSRGCDVDLATSTMLIHLYCKKGKLKDAFDEFEDMLRRGIVPQYLTYQRLYGELRKRRMLDMARALSDMMDSVPHSTKLPDGYKGDDDENASYLRRMGVLKRAKALSDALRESNGPRERAKEKHPSRNNFVRANRLREVVEGNGPSERTKEKRPSRNNFVRANRLREVVESNGPRERTKE